ncbi:MAG: carboxymuconolactone decarboxylase family protein [Terriglobales bacterium]
MLGDRALVDAVLEDFSSSPLNASEKALFAFVRKVNDRSWELGQEDVDEAKRAGWSDEALYDAITVCALFNFFNRWCDASGVHDMSAEDYEASGKRMARFGYDPGK